MKVFIASQLVSPADENVFFVMYSLSDSSYPSLTQEVSLTDSNDGYHVSNIYIRLGKEPIS